MGHVRGVAAGPPTPVGPYYRIPEVAQLLGISVRQTWALIAARKIRPTRFGPRATRVSAEALRDFVAAQEDR